MANWYYGLHHHDQKVAAVLLHSKATKKIAATSFTSRPPGVCQLDYGTVFF